MNYDYMELIRQSDALEAQLCALEEKILIEANELEDVEEILANEKADFYKNEDRIEPYGGAKAWNEHRRDAYIAENSSQAIELVKRANRKLRGTKSQMNIVYTKISGLNRKIRLLELASTATLDEISPE